MGLSSKFSKQVSVEAKLTIGRWIARFTDPPVLGKGADFGIGVTLKPWQRLLLSPSVEYSHLDYPDGSEIFEGYVSRTRINYQFTREWFLRVVVQYDQFDKVLSFEPLLSYKLNPFTIFYVGSAHNYREFDGEKDFTRTDQLFFLKLQYLLRV